jgi:translation initiation factor IF-3
MAHQEFGIRLLERVRKDLDEVGMVEQFPKLEGRQMVMVLGPKKKVLIVKPKAKAEKPKVEKAEKAEKEKKVAAKPAAA